MNGTGGGPRRDRPPPRTPSRQAADRFVGRIHRIVGSVRPDPPGMPRIPRPDALQPPDVPPPPVRRRTGPLPASLPGPPRLPGRLGRRGRPPGGGLRLGRPDRRLRLALAAVLFVLSLFAGRLVQLQGLDASALASAALQQRTGTTSLPAHRGDIVDSTGAVLATTVELRDVVVDQTLVPRYRRHPDERPVGVAGAARDIAQLSGASATTLAQRLLGEERFAYVLKGVAPETARRILRLGIPGISLEQASRRNYPAGSVGAAVLGFVGADERAWGGVEGAFDDVLAGTDGTATHERGADGTQIPTAAVREVPPRDGSRVHLTIDRDLQWQVQSALRRQISATKAESGSIVVMNPRTGRVLALATEPTFDPNRPGRAPEADRGNRALLDVFEPGSTSKVISIAAALEEGAATPATRVRVPGRLVRADKTFRDSEDHGEERLTTAGVLATSSNIGTIKLAEKISPERMHHYLELFGLGSRTGVGLPESSGILAEPDHWYGSQRYTVLFGQGLSVTALQVAGVFATLANDGVRVKPRIVEGFTDADGSYRAAPTDPGTRAVSADTARSTRLMLENVVGEHGTAVKATVPGYRVAGKTGTAEAPDPSCGCYRGYTASFIGMAPADDPQLVVAVILQRPQEGHYGGQVAAPVFQQVMTNALARTKTPPTGTQPPVMPLRWR